MSLNRRTTPLAAATLVSVGAVPLAVSAAVPAPAFTGKDLDGAALSLNQFKGKTVVLEWVNEGCPYVRKHYNSGSMQSTQRDARAEGVVWIQIVSSSKGEQGYFSSPGQAKAWLTRQKAAPTHMILDPSGAIGRAYKASTTPEMFVIDKAGQLVYRGGIDDKPSSSPRSLDGARNYVRAALADLKAGRPVQTAYAQSYGCSVKYS